MTAGARAERGRRRFGTASRLAGFLAFFLAVILSVAAFETVRAFTDQSLAAVTRSQVTEVDSYRQAIASSGMTKLQAATVGYLRSRVLPQGTTVMVGLPGGAHLGSAGTADLVDRPLVRDWLSTPPASARTVRTELGGVETQLLVTPIRRGATTLGTVVVAADLTRVLADQDRVRDLVIGEALVALIGAVACAYLLLRRLLREVGRITTTAASIERGELDHRLGDQGTDDEVGQLAATFDAMLDRLQAAMTVQRRLLSDVSHQLRTPLTVARGHLEVLARQRHAEMAEVRETVAVVVDELDHMRALVERLLLLGRALEPDFLEIEHLDLPTFVAELFDSAQVLAQRHWVLVPAPDVVLDVDVAKLRGALLNLVDNAVRATSGGDTIRISAVRKPAGAIAVAVDDSGPGIPADELARVRQRFGRAGAADRDGSGLGLAIVIAVAAAHGGSFALGASDLGGCRAAIELPAGCVSVALPRTTVGA